MRLHGADAPPMPWSKAMAYLTPEGIGEAALGSGMAGIQFVFAVQMELLEEYEEASRAWMSEAELWSALAAKLFLRGKQSLAGETGQNKYAMPTIKMAGSRKKQNLRGVNSRKRLDTFSSAPSPRYLPCERKS
jgi:hypothetical protein